MAEHTPAAVDESPINPQLPAPIIPRRTDLSSAADFLQESSRIGTLRTSYEKHRRYVRLHSSAIFSALVTAYLPLFHARWQDIKRFMDQYPPVVHNVSPQLHATRIYISAWFYDLYVSNREAARKLSPLAYSEHYQRDVTHVSYEYDRFLVSLNATIRPTNIRGLAEDVLYIPILVDNANFGNPDYFNPFYINNFTFNYDVALGLIDVLRHRKVWEFQPLVTNTTGRPGWLFDWHTDNRCCAWFPMEGNYSMDDVTIAYIIGEACTPKLGYRDLDDWQSFPDGIVPANIVIAQYDRLTERNFYGGYEVRTIETQRRALSVFCPPAHGALSRGKRPRTSDKHTSTSLTTSGAEPSTPATDPLDDDPIIGQYRIIDWTYYHLVVLNTDPHTRSGALKMIIQM